MSLQIQILTVYIVYYIRWYLVEVLIIINNYNKILSIHMERNFKQ